MLCCAACSDPVSNPVLILILIIPMATVVYVFVVSVAEIAAILVMLGVLYGIVVAVSSR